MHPLIRGLLAGAAGTVALNVTTYGDLLLRARPASQVPVKVADKLAAQAGIELGEQEQVANREQAVGALLGYVTALGVAVVYALVPTASGDCPPGLQAHYWQRQPWREATCPRPPSASPTSAGGAAPRGCPTWCRTWPMEWRQQPPRCAGITETGHGALTFPSRSTVAVPGFG